MSELSNFEYTGLAELEKLELNLKNYNSYILHQFIKHSNQNNKRVLDFGAGIGTLSRIWSHSQKNSSIDCLEPDKNQIRIIIERGLKGITHINQIDIYDYVFTSNVLEHIEHDRSVLRFIFNHLEQSGKVGIFVPANKYIYSHIDKKLEHFRRYSRQDLINKVKESVFRVETCIYVDSLGLFAWFFLKVFRIQLSESGFRLLLIYDRVIWPLSRFLDSLGFKFLFGKNLLLLASKN
jgi:hypothetical protein